MNTQKGSLWFLLMLGWCLPNTDSLANSVSIHPTADTTLQQAFPNNNFGDGTTFTAGERRQGGATRALVRFDVAGNVPSGATITSVSLTLNVTSTPKRRRQFDVRSSSDAGLVGRRDGSRSRRFFRRRQSSHLEYPLCSGDFLECRDCQRLEKHRGQWRVHFRLDSQPDRRCSKLAEHSRQ
jgi:hypothetical protein